LKARPSAQILQTVGLALHGIDGPQTEPDLDLVLVQGQHRLPEHSQLGHGGDRETNREEVRRGHLLDDVADEEER
jgi:hypothetical protein